MLRLWFPMAHESPATRPSLLLRIRNSGDQAAWQQFVEIYGPLIHGYCRHHGLQDSDAADLVQEVLQSVARAIDKLDYDPRRGAFRGWLFTITRNKMRDFLGREQRQVRGSGDSGIREVLVQQPSQQSEQETWNEHHKWRLFTWAAERIRGDFQHATWQAFWQTAVENTRANEVAKQLGISVGAVYIGKSRVLARLKEQLQNIEDE